MEADVVKFGLLPRISPGEFNEKHGNSSHDIPCPGRHFNAPCPGQRLEGSYDKNIEGEE
jgi:hypothetical protein